jgi:hypothetical protein
MGPGCAVVGYRVIFLFSALSFPGLLDHSARFPRGRLSTVHHQTAKAANRRSPFLGLPVPAYLWGRSPLMAWGNQTRGSVQGPKKLRRTSLGGERCRQAAALSAPKSPQSQKKNSRLPCSVASPPRVNSGLQAPGSWPPRSTSAPLRAHTMRTPCLNGAGAGLPWLQPVCQYPGRPALHAGKPASANEREVPRKQFQF